MSKEEFLKIQTCVLKVNIHCEGCKQKVKKILQKLEGVYTLKIDSDLGKVTVSGNVDPATLIKKLIKNGKHAEIWGAPKANNQSQSSLDNHFKSLQIDKGGNDKGHAQKGGGGGGGGGGGNQPKGAPNTQLQQLQQLQQMKGFQDQKLPFNNKAQNPNPNSNPKSVKFDLPEDDDDLSDDEFDDFDDDDDDYDDDEFDDEIDGPPVNKMKPGMGNGHGGPQIPSMLMNNMMKAGANNGGNGSGGPKKAVTATGGGGGNVNIPVQMNQNIPVQMNQGAKKGGNVNQNQGGGGKTGKNNGGQNKAGAAGNGSAVIGDGSKKLDGMNYGPRAMPPNMMGLNGGAGVGQMGNNMHMPMGQIGGPMSNLAAVQGLPASAMSAGNGAGYFPGGGPEPGNAHYQQQLAAMMMNQQRANGNERFQPMMYARPPPAVSYFPPYPYPPPPGERVDQYAMFSDENTSSCAVM